MSGMNSTAKCAVWTTIACLLCALPALAADATLRGVVRDSTGAVVPAATVIVRPAAAASTRSGASTAGSERHTLTGPDGRFSVEAPAEGDLIVVVRAGGFAEQSTHITAGDRTGVDIVLSPAGLLEAVTVTGSPSSIGAESPSAISVLTADTLAASPSAMLDDQLKSVPGFSLFRRTSSRVANPTTQGLTLRGLSASGASRGLVLVDGMPLNDPFGGWIYWDRIPQTALDRVEVVRGGSSDVYGADAVGGVIQILTATPTRASVRALGESGSRGTSRGSLSGGGSAGGWDGFLAGEWQKTDGYVLVSPDQAGPVDIAATSDYKTGYGTVGYQRGSTRATMHGNVFTEGRGNGTPLTNNDTNAREFGGDASGVAGPGSWLLHAYGGTETYNQSFSSIPATRKSESLTQSQHVPSRNAGGGGQWTMRIGPVTWSAGGESRRVEGTTEQTAYTSNVPTGTTAKGGVQWTTGGFANASVAAGDSVTIVGSLRADRWTSTPTTDAGSPQQASEVSPKAGVTWRLNPVVTLHAVATHAYRAPTLNELFRDFRAGSTLTSANDQLTPERLTSAEGGVGLTLGKSAVRAVGFWNRLNNAVTNVTVSSTPSLITRQRRNAGTIRAAGLELEEEVKLGPRVSLTMAEVFTSSTFVFSQEPGLTGKRVSQVPKASASVDVRYDAPWGVTAVGQYRAIGSQFDDDLNTLTLGAASILDASVSKTLHRNLQLFVAVENAANTMYDVGRTPVLTVGLPRTVRAGVRVDVR
jgi:outer membrane receptor protein involved in Fe transport